MRTFFLFSLAFLLAFSFHVPGVVADAGGTANGSACDLGNGGTGVMQDGQCVSPALYQSQSGGTGSSGGVGLLNPLQGGTSLESFLNNILSFVIRIGAIVVVLMLVYVGYSFVVAKGEPGKLVEARRMLLWTIIGALILLGAQAISLGIMATVQSLSVGG